MVLLQAHLSERLFLRTVLFAFLSVLIISISILIYTPPTDRDALTHHLFIPNLYLKHGGIYEIPSMEFSYYPMNLDLLYMIPLYWRNDILPKFIHFAFGLMTAGLLFGYLRRRLNAEYALLGALFFLSVPVIVKLSITVYVDLGLIFFSFGAIIYLLKWIENSFRLKNLIVSSLFCGLALGTKYNGLITCLLLVLLVPFTYSRTTNQSGGSKTVSAMGQLKGIGYGVIFICVSFLVFSPWMIKNYLWTNNPIYPLYNGWFNASEKEAVENPFISRAENVEINEQALNSQANRTATDLEENGPRKRPEPLGHFTFRRMVYGESWWQTFSIPFRIFFQGQDDNPRYFDGRLHPLLFFLPFFAFFNFKNNSKFLRIEKIVFGSFAVLHLIFVFFQIDMRIRWIAPIIPPLVILSILGLHEISSIIRLRFPSSSGKRLNAIILTAVIAFMIVPNAVYIKGLFHSIDPFSYLSGRVNRDEYIQRFRPEYPVIQYANAHLPGDARILGLLMGNRGYYFDQEVVFTEGLFWGWLKMAAGPENLAKNLKKERISHLFIRFDLFNKWVNDNFEDDKKELLKQFFERHAKSVFAKGGYGLFELRS
jgi:hypothetical protein